MASNLPVITWDYDFSPYSQKIRTLLRAASVPFSAVDQPVALPRPDLAALGITYRRIPVTAIGRDVYCDTAGIVAAIQRVHGGLPVSKADKAYEVFGINVFNACLPVIPSKLLTPDFVKDREHIFPLLKDPKLADMRPSAMAEMHSHIREIENSFLQNDPFVAGAKLGLADIHVVWSIRWLLLTLGLSEEKGCGPDAYPKLYKWIESVPTTEADMIDAQTASKRILDSSYVEARLEFDESDPLGIAKGTAVDIENADTTSGTFPQKGKLVGLNKDEVVLELDNGMRLHFPRTGYRVYKSQ